MVISDYLFKLIDNALIQSLGCCSPYPDLSPSMSTAGMPVYTETQMYLLPAATVLSEGIVRTWWNSSCSIPLFTFSFQLKIGRLRSGLDHGFCPSRYGIIWKLGPIWLRFLCWLVNCTSFPYISSHFFHEYRLSWFEFHRIVGGSAGLSFHQLLMYSGIFHRFPISYTGWNLGKRGSWLASSQSL